jgi:hypothetical protein
MHRNPDAAQRSLDLIPAGTLRRRILEYIADQGGELRSDSGQGLRRQICDALGERPTPVSQALIALEKAALLEREMDARLHRCHAIRVVSRHAAAPTPTTEAFGPAGSAWDDPIGRVVAHRDGRRSELDAARQELDDAIRRAAEASRRVERLRWAVIRADHDERVSPG